MNVEQAGQGEALTMSQMNTDLARLGLPPTAVTLIGGPAAAVDLIAALRVAVWLAGVIQRAGLIEVAAELYDMSSTTKQQDETGYVWLQREGVAREVARRVLDIGINQEKKRGIDAAG